MGGYKAEQYVRHRKKPDWGIGRVVTIGGDYITVRFQECAHDTTFMVATASNFLDVVVPHDVPAGLEGKTPRPKKARKAKRATTGDTSATCAACGKRLNRSRYSTDGRWKSCPSCSTDNGTTHVFRPFPDAFGTTPARETGKNPVGIQSCCATCRHEEAAEAAADQDGCEKLMCGDLRTQSKQP